MAVPQQLGDRHGEDEEEVLTADRSQGVTQGQEGSARRQGSRPLREGIGGQMARDSERGSQKPVQPQGAVNMHKVLATGKSRTESEDKALTEAQVERKER